MKKYILQNLSELDVRNLYSRPQIKLNDTLEIVKPILQDIKENGLTAVIKYAQALDKLSSSIYVTEDEINNSEKFISDELKEAIMIAKSNIEKFHLLQKPQAYSIETTPGVICSREFRQIECVGLYIPGGTAVLPSTVLMLGVPAVIAGCKRIVLCTPAVSSISPEVLYCAKLLGIKEIYKAGGAQAIGLMAYGCNQNNIDKVDKIFGPGNQFVTAAKMIVSIDYNGCAIDMPAGPSEVMIIADEYANSSFIAADLVSQAEHGADSQSILITTSNKLIEKVEEEISKQLENLPRKDYAESSLNNSFMLKVNDLSEAINFSNNYAPEHLILNFQNAENYTPQIFNAASVFIGKYTPESAGDYASGTNHSLPTSAYAKSFSGVGVESFGKYITFQSITKKGLTELSKSIIPLAEVEKLDAHKNAVTIRIKS